MSIWRENYSLLVLQGLARVEIWFIEQAPVDTYYPSSSSNKLIKTTMPSLTYETWKLWFASLNDNKAGTQNMAAFTGAMDAPDRTELEKINNLPDNPNNVFLTADGNRMIKIFHSPKDFGGTLLHPTHKVASLTGIGRSAICAQINITPAVAECKMNTPTREELAPNPAKTEFSLMKEQI